MPLPQFRPDNTDGCSYLPILTVRWLETRAWLTHERASYHTNASEALAMQQQMEYRHGLSSWVER